MLETWSVCFLWIVLGCQWHHWQWRPWCQRTHPRTQSLARHRLALNSQIKTELSNDRDREGGGFRALTCGELLLSFIWPSEAQWPCQWEQKTLDRGVVTLMIITYCHMIIRVNKDLRRTERLINTKPLVEKSYMMRYTAPPCLHMHVCIVSTQTVVGYWPI